MFSNFFWKSCRLCDTAGKYGTAGQATDDNIIRRMLFSYWITKATHTHTHSEYVILKFFHGNNGSANATECNVRTLPSLFIQRPSLLESFKEWRKKTQQQLGVKCQFPRILRRTGCEDLAVFGDQTMTAAVPLSHWKPQPEPQTTLVWH